MVLPVLSHLHCCDKTGNTIKNVTYCYSQNGSGMDCPSPTCSANTPDDQRCETEKHPSIGPFRSVGIEASIKNVVSVGAVSRVTSGSIPMWCPLKRDTSVRHDHRHNDMSPQC